MNIGKNIYKFSKRYYEDIYTIQTIDAGESVNFFGKTVPQSISDFTNFDSGSLKIQSVPKDENSSSIYNTLIYTDDKSYYDDIELRNMNMRCRYDDTKTIFTTNNTSYVTNPFIFSHSESGDELLYNDIDNFICYPRDNNSDYESTQIEDNATIVEFNVYCITDLSKENILSNEVDITTLNEHTEYFLLPSSIFIPINDYIYIYVDVKNLFGIGFLEYIAECYENKEPLQLNMSNSHDEGYITFNLEDCKLSGYHFIEDNTLKFYIDEYSIPKINIDNISSVQEYKSSGNLTEEDLELLQNSVKIYVNDRRLDNTLNDISFNEGDTIRISVKKDVEEEILDKFHLMDNAINSDNISFSKTVRNNTQKTIKNTDFYNASVETCYFDNVIRIEDGVYDDYPEGEPS